MREKHLACSRQANAAMDALEQPNTEFILEIANLTAQWRLRDVQALRRTTHVAFLGDRNEVTNLRKTHDAYDRFGANPSLWTVTRSARCASSAPIPGRVATRSLKYR